MEPLDHSEEGELITMLDRVTHAVLQAFTFHSFIMAESSKFFSRTANVLENNGDRIVCHILKYAYLISNCISYPAKYPSIKFKPHNKNKTKKEGFRRRKNLSVRNRARRIHTVVYRNGASSAVWTLFNMMKPHTWQIKNLPCFDSTLERPGTIEI